MAALALALRLAVAAAIWIARTETRAAAFKHLNNNKLADSSKACSAISG